MYHNCQVSLISATHIARVLAIPASVCSVSHSSVDMGPVTYTGCVWSHPFLRLRQVLQPLLLPGTPTIVQNAVLRSENHLLKLGGMVSWCTGGCLNCRNSVILGRVYHALDSRTVAQSLFNHPGRSAVGLLVTRIDYLERYVSGRRRGVITLGTLTIPRSDLSSSWRRQG